MSIPEEEGPPESEPWTVTGIPTLQDFSPVTVILLDVEDPLGVAHRIGVDRRQAFAIIDAFYAGDVVCIQPPEPWQIVGRLPADEDDFDRCQAAGVHVCSPTNSCDGA